MLHLKFLSIALAMPGALADIPQLFSPLIPQKVLATNNKLPKPVQYPQYTDRTVGTWQYFNPDTWTSGFFPVTLYAVNTRRQLCGATPANGLGAADWLALGRSASNGLLGLSASASIGHDVGFISFPFVEELAVCVPYLIPSFSQLIVHSNPKNQTAINAVNKFASQLAARFNPTVGCTRSWDNAANPTNFQVNMLPAYCPFPSADSEVLLTPTGYH